MDINIGNYVLLESTISTDIDPYNQESIEGMFSWEIALPYSLAPLERVLACSNDVISIPVGKLGFIELRSTWARLGLITPPTIADPGFQGILTMGLFNSSKHSMWVYPGMALWSIHLIYSDDAPYQGRYQGQTGITRPKAFTTYFQTPLRWENHESV